LIRNPSRLVLSTPLDSPVQEPPFGAKSVRPLVRRIDRSTMP
jgi:hypothetical protein